LKENSMNMFAFLPLLFAYYAPGIYMTLDTPVINWKQLSVTI
jgi:hypothetical protein